MSEADSTVAELPLDSAGAKLRRAREAAGLSRSDIAARTKIAERHLTSIEEGNYGALASRTYAVGFSRSYARALGLDELEIAEAVRTDLAAVDFEDRRTVPAFEPGDPARVPSARLAWLAALGGFAILLAGILFFAWRTFYAPGGTLPDLTTPESPAPVAPASVAAPPPQGSVVFTALEPDIWVKFYDASGTQLLQKQLAMGESYTVPDGVTGPMLWTARPDALQVSVGGKVLPRLSDKQQTMKDVPVTAAALLTRQSATPPSAAPTTGAAPAASGAPAASPRPTADRAAAAPSPAAAAAPAVVTQPAPAAASVQPSPPPAVLPPAASAQQPSTVSQ